ncbi:MAG TPA: adenylate/guanylate cyclase domain-containing protein [Candidatus Dormibacteraeota bacterium]|nr:adenylate/guanylate cyclase domain-containing protein [Candidatus Dormibacteraeota bacterium]
MQGASGAGHSREQRKVVTILFADVVGSTSLAAQSDPEVVRSMMSRYFKRIADVAEAYGGTVEKFAGDAAMVVFGVPVVHDDDAERAVRAAIEIRDAAASMAVRVGVNTGEAVTEATEDKQFMVSGDAVNVAARLQQGADPGEIVVGELTHQLTRNAIDYQPREPVSAKGKPEPLHAYRAVAARSQVPVQKRGVPGLQAALVGRQGELRLLLDTFARSAEDHSPHLFTIIGAAGIGKSRLVTEALSAMAETGARVLQGRCLPYGRGITYWPLIEMVRQDTGISLSDDRDVALTKIDRWLGELLNDDPQRPALRARLSVMLGLETADSVMPDTPVDRVDKEIAWAVRHYLEAVARTAPLVAVIDDLQWADPPVLETIEQLAERVSDAPIVIVCVARPEFGESHVGWGAGKANAITITLDPLNPKETATLIGRLLEIEALPSDLRQQIIERSAGTPLFCEEFIHMLIDEGRLVREDGKWRATAAVAQVNVPQSIAAVLAARLDGLPEVERNVLQAASIIGERFEPRQLQELVHDPSLESVLESLRRKGLLTFADRFDDELRFKHLLIRDAAYASLPKSQRAELHDRFGSALESQAGDPQQFAEILAHHAERAFSLSRELAMEGEQLAARARRTVQWSLVLADRARLRHDIQNLEAALQEARSAAAALPEFGGLDLRARIQLLEAQAMVLRADYGGAGKAAAESARLAEQGNLLDVVATARLTELWISTYAGDSVSEEFERLTALAVNACQGAGDVPGEIEARHLGTMVQYASGRLHEYVQINQELLERARAISDSARAALILERLANVELLTGDPQKADMYLAEADVLANKLGLRNVALRLMSAHGITLLQSGQFDAAVRASQDVVAAAEDAGAIQQQVNALRVMSYALQLQHSYVEMARVLGQAVELSESSGERYNRAEVLGRRARAAVELGDIETAERFIKGALEVLRPEDVTGTCEVYDHLGVLRAAQGRDAEAESALRHSVEVVINTPYHWPLASAMVDLARFLAQRDRFEEASTVTDQITGGWHMFDGEIAETRNLIAGASRG